VVEPPIRIEDKATTAMSISAMAAAISQRRRRGGS
jgi:hypothetical protein